MFIGCKLDVPSIQKIANKIKDISELNKDIDADWTYYISNLIEKSHRGRIDIDYDSSVSYYDIVEYGNELIEKGWTVYFNGTLYEYATVGSPYDISRLNGYIPDASSWNKVVLTPNKDVLKISIVNEKGEMLNDE
jgi:hypothetical protein